MGKSKSFQKGDPVKVAGVQGTFKVKGFREEAGGTVVTVYGGTTGHGSYRSFYESKVRSA